MQLSFNERIGEAADDAVSTAAVRMDSQQLPLRSTTEMNATDSQQ